MPSKNSFKSQINSLRTFITTKNRMNNLAQNVFYFLNLPDYMDIDYINKTLYYTGSIAFFYDDVINELVSLPFTLLGPRNQYGNPSTIEVYGENGYRRKLNKDEYVIMYDNTSRIPLYYDVLLYAQRLTLYQRILDINIFMQKTPRIFEAPADKVETLKRLIADIDSNVDTILAYEGLNINSIAHTLAVAPFVADKIYDIKDRIYAEYLSFIGISNLAINKRERQIVDEIRASQGGTIANRGSRYLPRKRAIERINKKFSEYLEKPIEVIFYDEKINELLTEGDDNNDITNSNNSSRDTI